MSKNRPIIVSTTQASTMPVEVSAEGLEPNQCRAFVEAVLSLAMRDQMLAWWQGFDATSGGPFMRYYGPVEAEDRRWWEMTSAPAEDLVVLWQYVVGLPVLERNLPPKGKVAVIKDGQEVTVHLEIPDACCFKFQWSDEIVA